MGARAVLLVGSAAAMGAAAYLALRAAPAAAAPVGSYAFDGDPALWSGEWGAAAPAAVALESAPSFFDSAADAVLSTVDDVSYSLVGYRVMRDWRDAAALPKNAAYVAAMHEAEQRHGMPVNLVVRQAWQESRFNPNAYNTKSGASGMMQIVPRWHPEVDVWNPFASIAYGAQFDAQLFRQFGTWEMALKAYNWGPGNVSAWLRGDKSQPLETRNYSAQILADIGGDGGGVFV